MNKLILLLSSLLLISCGVQSIPKSKNQVDAAYAEITNQYKRRADLIPNLVKTVKAYAKQEKETLVGVVEARAKATSIQIDPNKVDPTKIGEYQKLQSKLGSALGKLMMISERYPDLKSNQNFLALQSQLEGTENRITIARQRLIQAIKVFNDQVTVPPASWTNSLFYKHSKMTQWTVENAKEIEQVPSVDL